MRDINGTWVTGFGRAVRVTVSMMAKIWVLVRDCLTNKAKLRLVSLLRIISWSSCKEVFGEMGCQSDGKHIATKSTKSFDGLCCPPPILNKTLLDTNLV